MSAQVITPRYLTVKEAATYLGRSPHAVYMLIYRKQLRAIHKGRRVHLDVQVLDKWMADDLY